jgi:nicotinamidase/pyrazinamidase
MSAPLLFWDVDTQADFMLPWGKLYISGAKLLAPNLARLSEAADEYAIPVIASADDHLASDPEISDDPDWVTTFPPHCMQGTPGAARIPETAREKAVVLDAEPVSRTELAARLAATASAPAVVLLKHELDVFSNPNTETVLAHFRPLRIVLYGVATDFCSRYTIEGLIKRGYGERLSMVEDAVWAINPSTAPALVDGWRSQGLKTISTDEALMLAAVLGTAGGHRAGNAAL